jgi:hypothetical protein
LRAARGAALLEKLREAVQRLRTEDEVHVGRAADDLLALLARDAAGHADHELRARALERLHAAEIGEHLLLRLLAHRAGIEEDEVGFRRVRGLLEALGGGEHVGHLLRVVLVHLAPEGADEDFLRLRHGSPGSRS